MSMIVVKQYLIVYVDQSVITGWTSNDVRGGKNQRRLRRQLTSLGKSAKYFLTSFDDNGTEWVNFFFILIHLRRVALQCIDFQGALR